VKKTGEAPKGKGKGKSWTRTTMGRNHQGISVKFEVARPRDSIRAKGQIEVGTMAIVRKLFVLAGPQLTEKAIYNKNTRRFQREAEQMAPICRKEEGLRVM